jgi:hypothetical protein
MAEDGFFDCSVWGVEVPPGKTVDVPFVGNSYLNITNACIGEIPKNSTNEPNVITLTADTIDSEKYDEITSSAPVIKTKLELCSLIKGVKEHCELSHTFSIYTSNIKISNSGACPVYISGYLDSVDDGIEEEEEEDYFVNEEEEDFAAEEEDQEKNEEEVNKKLLDFVKRHITPH